MGEGTVAEAGAWDRCKPSVKHSKVCCQRRKDGQLVLSEVVHDLLRTSQVVHLIVVTAYKAAHVRFARRTLVASKNLQINSGEMAIGTDVKLTLELCDRLYENLISPGIGIALRARQAVDCLISSRQ
jgi:hypothetical protein